MMYISFCALHLSQSDSAFYHIKTQIRVFVMSAVFTSCSHTYFFRLGEGTTLLYLGFGPDAITREFSHTVLLLDEDLAFTTTL